MNSGSAGQGIRTSGTGGGSGGSITPQITVSSTDVSNGYITVPTITLTLGTTKVVRGGGIQDDAMYDLNSPNAGEISFPASPLVEGEVIKVFN